jgi:hypothetical protein
MQPSPLLPPCCGADCSILPTDPVSECHADAEVPREQIFISFSVPIGIESEVETGGSEGK